MIVLQDIAASSSANTSISCQHARIFWLPPDAIGYPNVNFSWSTIASRQRVFQTWWHLPTVLLRTVKLIISSAGPPTVTTRARRTTSAIYYKVIKVILHETQVIVRKVPCTRLREGICGSRWFHRFWTLN